MGILYLHFTVEKTEAGEESDTKSEFRAERLNLDFEARGLPGSPSSDTYQLCDLEYITYPLCVPVSS